MKKNKKDTILMMRSTECSKVKNVVNCKINKFIEKNILKNKPYTHIHILYTNINILYVYMCTMYCKL